MRMMVMVAAMVMLSLASPAAAEAFNCSAVGEGACGQHGTCNNVTLACDCMHGWNGTQCTEWPSGCPQQCSGHGECVPDAPDAQQSHCKCNGSYLGDDCSQPPAFNCSVSTLNRPCGEHGACNATTGQCECLHGWTGQQCTGYPVGCPDKCAGHGDCVEKSPTTSECSCHTGYIGDNCDSKVVPAEDDGWYQTLWIVVAIVFSVICGERLYSSCKRVYLRRTGRLGFQQLPTAYHDRESRALRAGGGSDSDDDDAFNDSRREDIEML
eukprot:TRINITY_DN66564_c13_g4_i1.p1 TRINITY_DN66564_c13_g4~~TRINITY_DN66564_c13_g4_i1.p1  ORF type:complete len:283 (-),score=85.32 TRINITY_DN66564_c13_g4_i1:45-845(-)